MLMHVLKTVKGHISLFFNHPGAAGVRDSFQPTLAVSE